MSIEAYLEHMRAKNRKQTTLEGYAAAVRACERCLQGAGISTDPEEIGPATFEFLQRALPMKETSRRVRMRAYAQYIEWETGTNPLKHAELLWNPERCTPHFISHDDFKICFSFFASPSPERMMLLLGATMGLRRAEMGKLTLEDYHGAYLTVHGKGHGPDGAVCEQRIPTETRREIEVYLQWRRKKITEGGIITDRFLIFTEKYGHGSSPEHMEAAISYHFKRISKETGIKVTPHSLRRLFATTLYNAGTDILTISQLMRHANPSITWRYIQATDDHAEIVDRLPTLLNIGDTITI